MKTGPRNHLVRDICDGLVYNKGQESMTSKGGIHGKA